MKIKAIPEQMKCDMSDFSLIIRTQEPVKTFFGRTAERLPDGTQQRQKEEGQINFAEKSLLMHRKAFSRLKSSLEANAFDRFSKKIPCIKIVVDDYSVPDNQIQIHRSRAKLWQ